MPELESLKGQIPFEEMVYVEATGGEEFVAQVAGVEFSPTLIHSRKLAIKAMVDLLIHTEKPLSSPVFLREGAVIIRYLTELNQSLLSLLTIAITLHPLICIIQYQP